MEFFHWSTSCQSLFIPHRSFCRCSDRILVWRAAPIDRTDFGLKWTSFFLHPDKWCSTDFTCSDVTQFLPESLKPIVPSYPDQMNEGIHKDDQAKHLGCTYLLECWNSTAAFLELLKNGPKEPFDMENNHSADNMWIHLVLLLGMHCYTVASLKHSMYPKRHFEFQQFSLVCSSSENYKRLPGMKDVLSIVDGNRCQAPTWMWSH